MYSILTGTLLISILHGLIPSHWLPIVALSKSNGWTKLETLKITFYLAISHVASTVLLGVILSIIGYELNLHFERLFKLITPIGLLLLGILFIYRHYKHHHFHIDAKTLQRKKTKAQIIASLILLMFLSPCLEIEGYFLLAGSYGVLAIILISVLYTLISTLGMLLWVSIALSGLQKLNWHKLEHNAGLTTGLVLIITGIISFFIQ